MEAPPPLSASTAAAAQPPQLAYPESLNSSPRSRATDSWDDTTHLPSTAAPNSQKLRLMCSYGGHIVPRPHDKSLCYVGGDTRIVVFDRQTTLVDLTTRLSKTLLNNTPFSIKYQLPQEDLDSLISVTTDEDLDNMIDEYDRLNCPSTSNKPQSRLRVFLFPAKPESGSSIGSILESSVKSEDWFLNALNGATSGFSESASVNSLLGLTDDAAGTPKADLSAKDAEVKAGVKHQDVHSVPDSPMLDTTSSFGSTSSSPSLANLPPIRVHVEEQKVGVMEEQFSQMGLVQSGQQRVDDGGFAAITSPPAAPTAAVSALPPISGEYANWVPSQPQPKQIDLASPDSVSSDGSITNPLSRQMAMMFPDPNVQNLSGQSRAPILTVEQKIADQNARVQMQQLHDSGYLLSTQFDPQQHHPQLHPQQQYVQAGSQYISHHPTGAVPMAPYYPLYPSQQQQQHHPPHHALDQQYMYYVPARQAQGYNLSVQQQSYGEAAPAAVTSSRPQTPPLPSAFVRNAPAPSAKPEMAAGVYRTATTAAPSLVQVPSSQHQTQYMGFSQVHHPSQSGAPTSAPTGNYAYEYADPTQAHIYYTQPLAPAQLAAQYQTLTTALPEAPAHLPTDIMTQQVDYPRFLSQTFSFPLHGDISKLSGNALVLSLVEFRSSALESLFPNADLVGSKSILNRCTLVRSRY
ncbi:hypothetical protein RJ639_030532 [Escallonia herrerae]|uniref:PB1 domain-containing protein n=1 Tax=Escallonia herrerae TaxID=1293975 RepID=A0AA88WYN5_9ASTE|nr:hypothetical protein RJ639_030532 [Escallonia herrerae]